MRTELQKRHPEIISRSQNYVFSEERNCEMVLIVSAILGYLIGSVPFALVIGKLFYHTDVRKYGSGNLGGGNTGRVLGKKAGTAVMTLDLLKVSFVVLLIRCMRGDDLAVAIGGLCAGIGHCFPVFAGFRGGKAVAAMYGFLFGLFAFSGRSPFYFFLPLAVFLAVLVCTKIIALSSIISALTVAVYICLQPESVFIKLAVGIYAGMIVIRHRANLKRIADHKENKVTWL